MVANSSTGRGACFFDRVAVRRDCSREDRIRLNGFEDSAAACVEDEGCFEREDEAVGGER